MTPRIEQTVIAHGDGSLEFEGPFAEPAERIQAALSEAEEADALVPWSALVAWPVRDDDPQALLESMPGVQRDSTFHDADMPGYSGHYATFSCAKNDVSSVLRQLETAAEQLWAWVAREDVDKRADAARIVDAARSAKKLRRDQAAAERAARVKEKTRRSLSEAQVRLALEASDRSPGVPANPRLKV